MIRVNIHDMPVSKFLDHGFFDKIKEIEFYGKYYLTGELKCDTSVLFFSETYEKSLGINGMIENGDMHPNGKLSPESEVSF